MVDAVKVVADGIRLEKKIVKSAEKHDYRSKVRSATHDATNISKGNDSAIIINAATGGSDKSAEVKDTEQTSSANRTETNETAETPAENEKESEN